MAWKQILSPNLDNDPNNPLYVWQGGQILTDWWGWCLAVVAASFGAKGSSYSAKTAWQSCPTKHYDRNIPEGMWVPLWYEGGTYGHVVIGHRTGDQLSVYSSPYTHIATFYHLKGELNWVLDYIGQVYGVGSFTGWSETVLDSRVIEKATETQPQPAPAPDPEPEPEPEPDPSDDNNNDGKDEDMTTPTEPSDSVEHPTQQFAGGILEEAIESADWFTVPNWVRLLVYIIADLMIIAAMVVPDIINAIQAPSLSVFGEYLAKVLVEVGTCLLMVFKLIKKK